MIVYLHIENEEKNIRIHILVPYLYQKVLFNEKKHKIMYDPQR